MGRPSLITEGMENFIRGELLREPRPKANDIFLALMKSFDDTGNPVPGEDAIIKRITKLKKEVDAHPRSELDNPFTIGACLKYNIPLTPALIEVYRLTLADADEISIRHARWFSVFLPLLEPRVKDKRPNLKPLAQLGIVVIIAHNYARLEQIAEIKGHPLDTSWMDNKHFIEEDFSDGALTEGFFRTLYTPQKVDAIKKQMELKTKEAKQ